MAKSGPRRCLHKHSYPLNFEKIFGIELNLDMESLTLSLQTWSTPSAAPVIFKVEKWQNSAIFAIFGITLLLQIPEPCTLL